MRRAEQPTLTRPELGDDELGCSLPVREVGTRGRHARNRPSAPSAPQGCLRQRVLALSHKCWNSGVLLPGVVGGLGEGSQKGCAARWVSGTLPARQDTQGDAKEVL